MASEGLSQDDPLLLLRQSIASEASVRPIRIKGSSGGSEKNENGMNLDILGNEDAEVSLARATHLRFISGQHIIALSTPTRFISSDIPVDLRSIYFAWLKRETAIPAYNSAALALNAELGAGAEIHKLAFVERLDLITWLEGASEESEYIKPLAQDSTSTITDTPIAAGTKGSSNIANANSITGRPHKTIDPRLAEIYNGERNMGDRNSILRGVKPTVGLIFLFSVPFLPLTLYKLTLFQLFASPFNLYGSHD